MLSLWRYAWYTENPQREWCENRNCFVQADFADLWCYELSENNKLDIISFSNYANKRISTINGYYLLYNNTENITGKEIIEKFKNIVLADYKYDKNKDNYILLEPKYEDLYIKPYIIPRFIDTTFACLTDRGTHKAVDKVQNYLRKYEYQYKNYWILKCDIKGFFYNIDQNILYKIMCKYISDKALLDFTKLLIYNNIDSNQVGIPIGYRNFIIMESNMI